MCAINFFSLDGLIIMIVFWVFMQCEGELKLENFEYKMVEDLS